MITTQTAATRTATRLELLAERLGRRISDLSEAAQWAGWRGEYGVAATIRINRTLVAFEAVAVRELAAELRTETTEATS